MDDVEEASAGNGRAQSSVPAFMERRKYKKLVFQAVSYNTCTEVNFHPTFKCLEFKGYHENILIQGYEMSCHLICLWAAPQFDLSLRAFEASLDSG